jgi:hypothetical protein
MPSCRRKPAVGRHLIGRARPRPAASLHCQSRQEGGQPATPSQRCQSKQQVRSLLLSRVALFRVRRRKTTSRRQEGNHPIQGLPRTLVLASESIHSSIAIHLPWPRRRRSKCYVPPAMARRNISNDSSTSRVGRGRHAKCARLLRLLAVAATNTRPSAAAACTARRSRRRVARDGRPSLPCCSRQRRPSMRYVLRKCGSPCRNASSRNERRPSYALFSSRSNTVLLSILLLFTTHSLPTAGLFTWIFFPVDPPHSYDA